MIPIATLSDDQLTISELDEFGDLVAIVAILSDNNIGLDPITHVLYDRIVNLARKKQRLKA